MVQASIAAQFWSSIEDCLVTFHNFPREAAAERVTATWRELPRGPQAGPNQPNFDDMIYHAEPWFIACNLADSDLPIANHESQYREILHRNHLA